MVKQTFKNLSPARQKTILMVAYEEFALKGYQNASLSAIIKKIGIAKGSFYRYFSGKRDLFSYLVEEGTGRRYMNLDRIVERPGISFFELIRQNFKSIRDTDKQNPVISGFLYQVMHERDNSEVSDIIEALYADVIERIKKLLDIPEFKRELNVVDPDFTAFHIFYSQLWFYDYVSMKYKINYEENIRNHVPVLNLPDEELTRIINLSVELLQHGIKRANLKQ